MAVDLDAIDKVMFFRRGESIRTRQVPIWFGLRRRTVAFTNYARVLVYATFKDAEHFEDADIDRLPFQPGSTIVKLFQNVPREDLEMVFPNVQVRMRRIDKLLIGVPAADLRASSSSSPSCSPRSACCCCCSRSGSGSATRTGDAQPAAAALGRGRPDRVRRLPLGGR